MAPLLNNGATSTATCYGCQHENSTGGFDPQEHWHYSLRHTGRGPEVRLTRAVTRERQHMTFCLGCATAAPCCFINEQLGASSRFGRQCATACLNYTTLQAAVNMTFDYLFTRPSYLQAGLNAIARAFGVDPPKASSQPGSSKQLRGHRHGKEKKGHSQGRVLTSTQPGGTAQTVQSQSPGVTQPPTILVFNMVGPDWPPAQHIRLPTVAYLTLPYQAHCSLFRSVLATCNRFPHCYRLSVKPADYNPPLRQPSHLPAGHLDWRLHFSQEGCPNLWPVLQVGPSLCCLHSVPGQHVCLLWSILPEPDMENIMRCCCLEHIDVLHAAIMDTCCVLAAHQVWCGACCTHWDPADLEDDHNRQMGSGRVQ
jgi:hypothetical protein